MKIQVGFTAVSHHPMKWTKSLSSQIYLWITLLWSFSLIFPPQGRSSVQTWYCLSIFQCSVNFQTLFLEESYNLLLAVVFVHLITANSGVFTHRGCFVSLQHLVLATAGGEINVSQTQLCAFELSGVVDQWACGTLQVNSQQGVNFLWLGSISAPPGHRAHCGDWLPMCWVASSCKMYAKPWWTWTAGLTWFYRRIKITGVGQRNEEKYSCWGGKVREKEVDRVKSGSKRRKRASEWRELTVLRKAE